MDIPSRIREKHLKIWGKILNVDSLTIPLLNSIMVAQKLYILRPHVNAQPGHSQTKADINHALVWLTDLWRKFEAILRTWAKTEVKAHADAANKLTLLEEVRFIPLLSRFVVVLDGYGEPGLLEEVHEFVETTMRMFWHIEPWLQARGVWL